MLIAACRHFRPLSGGRENVAAPAALPTIALASPMERPGSPSARARDRWAGGRRCQEIRRSRAAMGSPITMFASRSSRPGRNISARMMRRRTACSGVHRRSQTRRDGEFRRHGGINTCAAALPARWSKRCGRRVPPTAQRHRRRHRKAGFSPNAARGGAVFGGQGTRAEAGAKRYPAPTDQWFRDGAEIAGATSPILCASRRDSGRRRALHTVRRSQRVFGAAVSRDGPAPTANGRAHRRAEVEIVAARHVAIDHPELPGAEHPSRPEPARGCSAGVSAAP